MHTGWIAGLVLGSLAVGNWRLAAQNLPTGPDELRVTVYGQAHLPPKIVVDAVDQLRLILHGTGIAIDACMGELDAAEASLFTYVPQPPKNKERETACRARRDIVLKITGTSPAGLRETVLGMSSPYATMGINVRLFSDHIWEAATRHNRPYAMVLAYVMAHEIGHVLLRGFGYGHSPSGLMSSVWTGNEYGQMARGQMYFTDHEAEMMLANLRGPMCSMSDNAALLRDKSR